PRIATAQCAYDHVVTGFGVLDSDDVFSLSPRIAERGYRCRCVFEEPFSVSRVNPCACNYTRAITRTDLVLIGVDQHIERGGVNVALLLKDCAECSYAQLHLIRRTPVLSRMAMGVRGMTELVRVIMFVAHIQFYTVPPSYRERNGNMPRDAGFLA